MLTTLAQNLKLLKPEREGSREKNQSTGDWTLQKKRACIIFRSLGGEAVELCYEPHIYGIQQIDSVETLLLFTSKTDKACLRDLFDPHCFMGEAEKQVHDFCFT